MLSYANLQPRIPPGFCCVGSPPVAGGGDVRAWRHARRGGPRAERDVGRDQSLVSGVAGEGPARAEGRGPRGPQTAPRADRLGEARAGIAGRASGAGLSDRGVDLAPRRHGDRAADGRGPSSGACLARAARVGVVAATARPPRKCRLSARMNGTKARSVYVPGQVWKKKRLRRPSHRYAKAPATDSRFQLLPVCTSIGVAPRGAQVRRTTGCCETPLSSSKTSQARWRAAFFLAAASAWSSTRRSRPRRARARGGRAVAATTPTRAARARHAPDDGPRPSAARSPWRRRAFRPRC